MYFLAPIIVHAKSNLKFVTPFLTQLAQDIIIITFLKSVNGIKADGSGHVIQADEPIHYALNRQVK